MEETKMQSCSWAGERCISEEEQADMNGLLATWSQDDAGAWAIVKRSLHSRLWPSPGAYVGWYLWLLLPMRAIQRSVVCANPWSHDGAWGPCCLKGNALPPGALVTSGPQLLLRIMSGSMVLLQPRSVLMFTGPCCHQTPHDAFDLSYTICDHDRVWGLCHYKDHSDLGGLCCHQGYGNI